MDTHVLLWWLNGDRRLPAAYERVIGDGANDCLVSAVAIWEMAIKVSIGKLRLAADVGPLGTLASRAGLSELPMTAEHAAAVQSLPMHHADPFDRLLIAQAQTEGLAVATIDASFAAYQVTLVPSS